MSGKAERRAAREAVAAYHEAEMVKLVERVAEATDRFRSGPHGGAEIRVEAAAGSRVRVRVINTDDGATRTWVAGAAFRVVAVDAVRT